MAATNLPQTLTGQVRVGSNAILRNMALDIDSSDTIVRIDNITYNQSYFIDPITQPLLQTLRALERKENSQADTEEILSGFLSENYIPYYSSTINYTDRFIYKDPSFGALGYSVKDQICYRETQASTTHTCFE